VKVKTDMRIGELAKISGVSARSLRYYEQQGLLSPERRENGYRTYGPDAVETVNTIRTLLAAGLSTATVAEIMPCTNAGPTFKVCGGLEARLAKELAVLDARLGSLAASRDLLVRLLATRGNGGESRAPRRPRQPDARETAVSTQTGRGRSLRPRA
jgi:DNA-binding transcriptional MerR regulator